MRSAAWAILAGLVAARFFEPSLGYWSIGIGVSATVAVDVVYRRREWVQERRRREAIERRARGDRR